MKNNLLLTFSLLFLALASVAQNAVQNKINEFASRTEAIPTIDKATNSLSFLRFPVGKAYKIAGNSTQEKALSFLKQNGELFSMESGTDTYLVKEKKRDNYGMDLVAVQQYYMGVPVFDGVLKFHFNKIADLSSVNGNYISVSKINPTPSVTKEEADKLAIKYVTDQKMGKIKVPLKAVKNNLYIFQKGLAQGYQGTKHLVYEVEVRNDADIREILYIDAHTKALVEQFTGMHNIERKLYDKTYDPNSPSKNLIWKEKDSLDSLNVWQKSEVETAGQIYNLMKNAFGYVSYDNEDAVMITTHNNPQIACPNANWNGVSANYCDQIAADDIVAHEWAHAYTEYTSGLIYQWQAGAMNEAYSDIWGETVDQLNKYFDQGESMTLRTGCDGSARWQLGEQATAFGGAIRDMWNPNCFGDPGKVSDPQYHCEMNDYGGVHGNSAVLNHTYALLVDGGTYNGQTIKGLGFTKAAHIFWRAQSMYMTQTTDFASQADILEASLLDLIGIDLPALSTSGNKTTDSGEIITEDDWTQLKNVLLAVELRSDNLCGHQTILKPVAVLCEGASDNLALFHEDFESGLGDFKTTSFTSSASWVIRNWTLVNAPAGREGKVAFGIDLGYQCDNSNDQAGVLRLESPPIVIPAETAGNLNMAFDHYVATEDTWDGGNIKYSINGANWLLLPAKAFIANGYNSLLSSRRAGNNNPLQGQPAFTGFDQGTFNGSWGQSQIDLTSLGLTAGDTIQFRWEMGTDVCGGGYGWYVDDIKVYTCQVTPAVHFVLEKAAINEAEGKTGTDCLKYVDKVFAVQIDKAPSQPVTLTFDTSGGTAKMGTTADYTISPASITLKAGSLIQNVTVRIYDDAYVEGEETIDITYKMDVHGGNGYAATTLQHLTLSIIDDDLTPGNYTEDLLVADFNQGQEGWSVINGGNNGESWLLSSYGGAGLDPDGLPFFFVNSGASGTANTLMDEVIESPAINSAGKKNLVLTFSQDWRPSEGDFPELGMVDIWDGSAWRNVLTQTEATGRAGNILTFNPDIKTIEIPDEYASVNMKIRFRYVANWDGWWAVDNVKLSSSNSTEILTAVNTSNADRQYLGPNETAVFYDPATGSLMAKIKNLSNHDYGCTTVSVDRAGIDATDWLMSYHITKKTFKVTPTNANANGKYEITLYYKASELPNFNGSAITSMGKSPGSIAESSLNTGIYAEVSVNAAFNTDYAFTSVFDSGFSGFGLSDAPPAGPLPVTLTKFEGKHTAEGNVLNWETTAEVNSDYFVLEHSPNAVIFTEIARITNVVNPATRNPYSYTDSRFGKGLNYYRLKQVDKDGTFAYSRIVVINAMNLREVVFYPNPVQSLLHIELPDADMKQVNLKIMNSAGKIIATRDKVKASKGAISHDMNKLPAGIYHIIISDEKSSFNFPVFKF